MAEHRNIVKSTAEYTRSYENLRGIDLSDHSPDAQRRFAYLENMYVDYEGGGSVESIPGFRKIATLKERINRIYSQRYNGKEYLIIHAGTKLYRLNVEERDSGNEPVCIADGLLDTRSCGGILGNRLFILDGEKFTTVKDDGTAKIFDKKGTDSYIPTAYRDCEEAEARNLLTHQFCQYYTIKSAPDISYSTPTLIFSIIDYEEKLCSVSGIGINLRGNLHIPSCVLIGGNKYKVIEIADGAFSGKTGILEVYTSYNLRKIGKRAFAGCTGLKTVIVSDSVEIIDTGCFDDCAALDFIYVGRGMKKFGNQPFARCPALKEIQYASSLDDYQLIENVPSLENLAVTVNAKYGYAKFNVPVFGRVSQVYSVTVDGESVEYTYNSQTQCVVLECDDRDAMIGKTLEIRGIFIPDEGQGFLSTEMGKSIDSRSAVLGCKCSCVFDGRLFLSGNPLLPGVIFYSSKSENGSTYPPYFGAKNYIFDGVGGHPVTSLLSLGDRLLVFKGGDDGSGSIFYHEKEIHDGKDGYPVKFVRNGISATSDSCSFDGEAVFVGSSGICASVNNSTDSAFISRRSEKISRLLATQDSEKIRLTEWKGYLVVACGSKFFLADSRSKYRYGDDYLSEWYYLSDIGAYENDRRIYKYASKAKEGYTIRQNPPEKVSATVLSRKNEFSGIDYYTVENGEAYAVNPTDEYEGGSFYPATEVFALGDLLFFGTDFGHICLFNNDKRGVAPTFIEDNTDFSAEEYESKMGNTIHPYYYSFDRHRVKYLLATVPDNCGIPYLEKISVRGSLTLKFKCMSDGEIAVKVKTDKSGMKELCKIKTGALDFYCLNFSNLSIAPFGYSTLSLNEYERGWVDKQYILCAEGYCSPIGIHSLSYRYKIKGKIKNK